MVLLGFNIMVDNDKKHFFDDHPKGLAQNTSYHSFAAMFDKKNVPADMKIINVTTPTRLKSFPQMSLEDAIQNAPK